MWGIQGYDWNSLYLAYFVIKLRIVPLRELSNTKEKFLQRERITSSSLPSNETRAYTVFSWESAGYFCGDFPCVILDHKSFIRAICAVWLPKMKE